MYPENILGSRAAPSRITVFEEYVYEINMCSSVNTRLCTAQGTIDVQIPYSEGQATDPAANERKTSESALGNADVLVGYIGLSHYQQTSLLPTDNPAQDLQPLKFPVNLPSRDANKRISLSSMSRRILNYQISEPSALPVEVNAVLVDDTEGSDWKEIAANLEEHLRLQLQIRAKIGQISNEVRHQLQEKVRRVRTIAQKSLATAQKNSSKPGDNPPKELEKQQTLLDQYARLSHLLTELEELGSQDNEVPTCEQIMHLAADATGKEVDQVSDATRLALEDLRDTAYKYLGTTELAYLGIRWPYSGQTTQNLGWTFNPELGRIEMHRVKLEWNKNTGYYETMLYLNMYVSNEPLDNLEGLLVLETAELLSRMKVSWFNSEANRYDKVSPTFKSSIVARLNTNGTSKLFERRRFLPKRELIYPGVLPSSARLRDAESVLEDAGLSIIQRSYSSADLVEDFNAGQVITATKKTFAKPMQIWLRLIGSTKAVTHRVKFDHERQEIEESTRVGDLRVQLFASVIGDSKQVNLILNEIEDLLDSRMALPNTFLL